MYGITPYMSRIAVSTVLPFRPASLPRQELHPGRRKHLLPGGARVARRFLHGRPAEDRHQLPLGRAVLGSQSRARLAQSVGGTMLQPRRVALLAEPVAEAISRLLKKSGLDAVSRT